MSRLRVALLTELFYPHIGGNERRFFEIGRRLAKKGHDIHVFTIRYDENLPKEEVIEGMTIHRYVRVKSYIMPDGGRSSGGVLKYAFATFTHMFKSNFDVYYSNEWPMLHSIFAGPTISPLIQEWCEVWIKPLRAIFLQNLLKKVADHHVAVSEFTKQRLIRLLKLNPKEITIIPNGVDYAKYRCDNFDNKVWGRIVYVGRLVPHKHIELLLDAFRYVKEKIANVELHIIGSGPMLPKLKERATNIDGCFFHGSLPDDEMIRLLKSAWLFVLPSEREGSGIAALEAMAAGVPVITVNFPDNATKLLAKYNCCLVTEPNSDSIASEILSLLYNEDLWKKIRYNAISVAKRYDWNAISDDMENLLRKIAYEMEE
ncbi:MAG: glycosyltransferase family 4 protein [Candidatus Bathyarchaeia archaeon]